MSDHSKTGAEPQLVANLRSLLRPLDGWGSFRQGARPAAVTAVLYLLEGQWHVPFVARRADLADHPGQVALPGGGVQEGESAWQAAAREVQEEIGIRADRLVPLGAGAHLYTAVSNFSVAPFVAYLPDAEVAFKHDPGELEGILEIPLDRLLAEAAWTDFPADRAWMGKFFPWQETMVWGLTARLLDDLIPIFRTAAAP